MASINMKSLVVGEQPPGYDVGDAYHHILMSILMAARAHDKQAIDGPYLQIRDVDGFRRVAGRSAALGFDGKWVLHPGQIDAANEVYSPTQEDFDHAEHILDAYAYCTSEAGGKRGSAMIGDEMIDEASPQDGAGDLGQGPRGGHAAHEPLDPAGELTPRRRAAAARRAQRRSRCGARPGVRRATRCRRRARAATPVCTDGPRRDVSSAAPGLRLRRATSAAPRRR